MVRLLRGFVGGGLAIAILAVTSAALASTGNFSSPLTSNVLLSVDLNGGPLASATAPTNGYNENQSSGAFSVDNFGVVWTPWGGNGYSGGDSVQLPSSQSSPNVAALTIQKTFSANGPPAANFGPGGTYGPIQPYGGGTNQGNYSAISPAITVTVSGAGTASNYGTVNGSTSLNSRDRGSPTAAWGQNDSDMFRDLIFAGGSGSNVQGTNYLQVTFTGLSSSTAYQVALYSYDSTGNHTTNWTATAPTNAPGSLGWWNGSNDGIFTAPADGQSITWTSGTTPAPAVFTVTSDATGALSVYGWGGDGITGDQSSDTSYLDGFQIATVPEPGTLLLLGLAAPALLWAARKRKK
jgi:hypothetical protein